MVDCIDVFTRKIYKDIVVDSLKYCCENKGMILFGWRIISNHIHLIFGVEDVFLEPPSDNILAQPIRYHKYKKNDISGDFELVENPMHSMSRVLMYSVILIPEVIQQRYLMVI